MLKLSVKEAKKLGVLPGQTRRKPRKARKSEDEGEDGKPSMFEIACIAHGLPAPKPEFPFAEESVYGREFKADWAWVDQKVLLEVEGGVFGRGPICPVCGRRPGGAHSSVTGILRDIEKYNLATELGYRVVRALPHQVSSGEVFAILKRLIR